MVPYVPNINVQLLGYHGGAKRNDLGLNPGQKQWCPRREEEDRTVNVSWKVSYRSSAMAIAVRWLKSTLADGSGAKSSRFLLDQPPFLHHGNILLYLLDSQASLCALAKE